MTAADLDDPAPHPGPVPGSGRPVRGGRRPQVVLVHLLPVSRPRLDELHRGRRTARPSRASPATIRPRAWSPIGTAERSAGSASGRARTTPGWPLRRSSRRSTTPRSGPSCASSCRAGARRRAATALLDAAVDYARDHGATMLEAYPVDTAGERIASANAYHGTLGCSSGPASGRRATPVEQDAPDPADRASGVDIG